MSRFRPVLLAAFGLPLLAFPARAEPAGPVRLTHGGPVQAVAFSPDGKSVFTGSEDKTLRQWDVATGKERRKFVGHQGAVFSVAVSRDGKLLASGGEDQGVRLWDVSSGKEVWRMEQPSGYVSALAFAPRDLTLLAATDSITRRPVRLGGVEVVIFT